MAIYILTGVGLASLLTASRNIGIRPPRGYQRLAGFRHAAMASAEVANISSLRPRPAGVVDGPKQHLDCTATITPGFPLWKCPLDWEAYEAL